MTMAVCFQCGVIKFGAWVPCPKCSGTPRNEDDLALSLAMTDHYFDMPTLERMSADVQAGIRPNLDKQTRDQIVAMLHQSGMLEQIRSVAAGNADLAASAFPPPVSNPLAPKKPWWKFW